MLAHRSLTPRPEKGFHMACEDLEPERKIVVYPGEESYSLGNDTRAISLPEVACLLAGDEKG